MSCVQLVHTGGYTIGVLFVAVLGSLVFYMALAVSGGAGGVLWCVGVHFSGTIFTTTLGRSL